MSPSWIRFLLQIYIKKKSDTNVDGKKIRYKTLKEKKSRFIYAVLLYSFAHPAIVLFHSQLRRY